MVDWKLYIDSPQERALKLCYGSLTEGNGNGYGNDTGKGYFNGYGTGWGGGGGWSATEW